MIDDEFYYLDFEVIEIINEAFCGPGAGVRDREGVLGIVHRPRQEFFGIEQFPGLFMKAAALLHGFSTTQYFSDGNKRTSFLSATVFLESNGQEWIGPEVDAAEDFLLRVAANEIDVEEVATWLEDGCA
ncbi:MAG: type II toxin-antitoxin system death-on-curing family toxin [Pseudoclavibacter sp.]